MRPLLNGRIHEDGDGREGGPGCRMLGTGILYGGPSIILIPLPRRRLKLRFFSIDVTIFGVLKFHDF